jgi:hypothetical protein
VDGFPTHSPQQPSFSIFIFQKVLEELKGWLLKFDMNYSWEEIVDEL